MISAIYTHMNGTQKVPEYNYRSFDKLKKNNNEVFINVTLSC